MPNNQISIANDLISGYGPSFPTTGLYQGKRWFNTTYNDLFYYDTAQAAWVSVAEYTFPVPPTGEAGIPPYSVSAGGVGRGPLPVSSSFPSLYLWPQTVFFHCYHAAPCDASNNWNYRLIYYNSSSVSAILAQLASQSMNQFPANFKSGQVAVASSNTRLNYFNTAALYADIIKAGSPGAVYPGGVDMAYRKLATS